MRALALPVLLFATCIIASGFSRAADVVEFTPANGFGGESEGRGSLKMLFGTPRPFHVKSLGTAHSDGSFRIAQTVTFHGDPPQERVWHITPDGAHRYTGTLSDASGPVSGASSGMRLSLKYRIKGLLVMRQQLELMPDGRTISNTGTLTVLGIPVGRLHETITRKRSTQ